VITTQFEHSDRHTMSDGGDSADMEDVGTTPTDFFDHEPSKQEKIEVSAIFDERLIDGTLR
jgi:hypothetical protein